MLESWIKPEFQMLRQGIKEKSASSSKQEIKAKWTWQFKCFSSTMKKKMFKSQRPSKSRPPDLRHPCHPWCRWPFITVIERTTTSRDASSRRGRAEKIQIFARIIFKHIVCVLKQPAICPIKHIWRVDHQHQPKNISKIICWVKISKFSEGQEQKSCSSISTQNLTKAQSKVLEQVNECTHASFITKG